MNAAELREALEIQANILYLGTKERSDAHRVLVDAARTIALPILEADPELVERIAQELFFIEGCTDSPLTAQPQDWIDDYRWRARRVLAVLAAISTPTPGAE